MNKLIIIFVVLILNTNILAKDNLGANIRIGYVKDINHDVTNAIGLTYKYEQNITTNIEFGTALYSTYAINNQNEATQFTFLDTNNKGYSTLGELYINYSIDTTSIKIGRQALDTPHLDTDDIAMVSNSFEAISIVDKSFKDTTITLASVNKWSGVDSPEVSKFTNIQNNKPLNMIGIEYEGFNDIALSVWEYDLEDTNYHYLELSYNINKTTISTQASLQGNGNEAFGIQIEQNINNLTLTTAYNDVTGIVSNGFGGGAFYTSSEDHTIDGVYNNDAYKVSGAYEFDKLSVSIGYVDYKQSESETDYCINYEANENLSLDLIYQDMDEDGKMTRFFMNYSL
jgi:hypothetical protein